MNPKLVGGAAHRKFSAYTIVEVLVAVLVLGTMAISLYAGFSSGFALLQLSQEDTRATQILARRIEAIRLCTWTQLSGLPFAFRENYDPFKPTNDQTGLVYSGTVSASLPDAIPDSASYKTNILLVTVAVYWTNFSGTNLIVRSRTNQTLIARYGLQNYFWGSTP